MSVRERILAIRLMEKQKSNLQYAKEIGVDVYIQGTQSNKPIDLDKNSERKEEE